MKNTSTLEYALIGLLRQKAQSGYDLRKTFVETAMRHYSDSPGSIYPALRRLARKGLIEAEPKDRRGREVFHLTAAGVEALLEWLGQGVTRDSVVLGVKELMLRFAFMGLAMCRARRRSGFSSSSSRSSALTWRNCARGLIATAI